MSDIKDFSEQGFAVVRGVLDKRVAREAREFLESRISPEIALACKEIGCPDPAQFVSYIGKQAESAGAGLSKSTRDTLSGHFSLETRLSKDLWSIPRDAGLRALLEQTLRSRSLFMHMPPTARFVLPGNVYAGVPAHQDVSYNHHMPEFVTAWIPFVDIDSQCGGVTVFKGSNVPNEALSISATERFWLKSLPTDGYTPVHCEMQVGDVLLLSKWVVHQSMPNRSGRTRISMDCRFFGNSGRSTKHFLDMQHWKVVAPGEDA